MSGEYEGKRDECSESMMRDISDCVSSVKPSRSNYLEEVNSKKEENYIDLPCSNSVHDNFHQTESIHNSLEYTKSNFTSTYDNEYLANITERSVEPAYQCSDITSDGTYNTSVSSLNESKGILSDSEIHMYQYDTVNDSNISCSVSTNACNSLMSNSELEDVQQEPQSDRSTARDMAHVVESSSKFHITEDVTTLLDVRRKENIGSHERDSCNSLIPSSNFNEKEQNSRYLDKPILNGNEPEIEVEYQKDQLPCQIHDDYLLETNTPRNTTEWRNLSSSEPECGSNLEDWTINSENSPNTAQVLEEILVPLECKEELVQVGAPKHSFLSTTPMNDSHARYENALDEDLHDCSDFAEKYAGQEVPNTSIVKQEYLLESLLTSMTEQTLEKGQGESFEIPKVKTSCQTQNIRKKRRLPENSTMISEVSYPVDENEWIRKTTNSKYGVACKDNVREVILPTVNDTLQSHSKSHQFKQELLQYNSASSTSCESPCGAIADSGHELETSSQNVFETCNIKCPNSEENSELSSYVDNPVIKLEFQDDSSNRAEEEYVPQHVTCKREKDKSKRVMLNPELEYNPTDLKILSSRNKRSCTVEDSLVKVNLPSNIGTPETDLVGYPDEIKLEFQTNPYRVDNENVLEKVAHNCEKGKRQMNIPTNVNHLATEHVSCSGDCSEVQKSEFSHDTGEFKDFPSCVEKRDCAPKRKQQRQTTDRCDSSSICDKKKDTENIFEEDLNTVSTNNYDSLEMPDAVETSQGLMSHVNEENNHRKDYQQSFQICTYSAELDERPLIKSTMLDSQEAAQEGMKISHPSKPSLRSFRLFNDKDETNMKRIDLRKKNACHNTVDEEINSYVKQKKRSKKEQTISNKCGSDTAVKSSLHVHDFYSLTLQSSNSKQVDACEGIMQPEILGHESDNISLQSSTSELFSQNKARKALSNVNQSNKRKKEHPGGKADEAESNRESVSNSKKYVKQIKRQKGNREAQVLQEHNNAKTNLPGGDRSDKDLMPAKNSTPEEKGKSAQINKRHVSSPKKKQSTEKFVTQAEELDPSERDSVMEEDGVCVRRSSRIKARIISKSSWFDEDYNEETEKNVKFFEKYKERKLGKSNLELNDKRISKSAQKGKCHVKNEKRGSKSAEPEGMKNKTTEKLWREYNTPSKALKNSGKSKKKTKVLTPTAGKKRKATSKNCKKISDLPLDDEQEEKVKRKNKSIKEVGRLSVSPIRKQGSSLKKSVKQKSALKIGTSTLYDSEKNLENCASTSKSKTLGQARLSMMERQDAVKSGSVVSEQRRFRITHRSQRSEELGASEVQGELPDLTERGN